MANQISWKRDMIINRCRLDSDSKLLSLLHISDDRVNDTSCCVLCSGL